MTDFVLKQRQKENTDNIRRFWSCESYAKFLKTPLKLEMFVPVFDSVHLDKPKNKYGDIHPNAVVIFDGKETTFAYYMTIYKQAKEKVLFEGFEPYMFKKVEKGWLLDSKKHKSVWVINGRTVEDLVYMDLELTETALKKIEI